MVKWSLYTGRRKKDPVKIFLDSNIETYDSFVRYCMVRGIVPADRECFDSLLERVNSIRASSRASSSPLPPKKIRVTKEKSDPPKVSKNNASTKKSTRASTSKKKSSSRGKK